MGECTPPGAVRSMLDTFAVGAGLPPYARAEPHMTARSDEDLLAAVIDEVIYCRDADDEVPSSRGTAGTGWWVIVFLVLARAAADRGQSARLRLGYGWEWLTKPAHTSCGQRPS